MRPVASATTFPFLPIHVLFLFCFAANNAPGMRHMLAADDAQSATLRPQSLFADVVNNSTQPWLAKGPLAAHVAACDAWRAALALFPEGAVLQPNAQQRAVGVWTSERREPLPAAPLESTPLEWIDTCAGERRTRWRAD